MTQNSGIYTWSKSFAAGSEITSVLVAPPIDASNPYQKGIDYGGSYGTSLDSSTCLDYVSLSFPSPGVYAVEVTFAAAPTFLEFLWAGALQANDDQAVANGRTKVAHDLLTASPGAYTVEQPPWEDGFDANAADIVAGSVRTVSVADAMRKLNTAFTNNGSAPMDVVMVGHAKSSQINVGKTQHAPLDGNDGYYLKDNIQWVQNFCNGANDPLTGKWIPGLNGKIKDLLLLGCDIGQNFSTNQNHLIKSLANGLHQGGGISVAVSAYDNKIWAVAAQGNRAAHFEIVADANLITFTAGPAP